MQRFDSSAIPDGLRELCGTLHAEGEQAWIVGGCLRDLLLGKPVSDWDVATSATPDRVRKLFRKVIPTGVAHGTVTVRLRGTSYEVTTFRGEGAYTDGRHPDEVFFVGTIEEDLARRDFTVNALAYDPTAERLVDPFGGLKDLEQGLLRAVGDPRKRFEEDGLRVLRGARFTATLGFDLERETERAIGPSLRTFRQVSRERVRDEWLKTMTALRPSRAFEIMRATGILRETCSILSCLSELVVDEWEFRGFDHALASVDAARAGGSDPVGCVIALLSGVGRPSTATAGFVHHERVAADLAGRWFRDYRFSNEERKRAMHLLGHQALHVDGRRVDDSWTAARVRRWLKRVTPSSAGDVLSLREAILEGATAAGATHLDGRPVAVEQQELQRFRKLVTEALETDPPLKIGDLAIGGQDILRDLGVSPGRRVGQLLEDALEAVLEDPELNEREALLRFLRRRLE